MVKPSRALVVAAALAVATLTVVAQERNREKIPDKYKWNLADIYPSVDAWRAAKE
jgi:oligoendopeptidase F